MLPFNELYNQPQRDSFLGKLLSCTLFLLCFSFANIAVDTFVDAIGSEAHAGVLFQQQRLRTRTLSRPYPRTTKILARTNPNSLGADGGTLNTVEQNNAFLKQQAAYVKEYKKWELARNKARANYFAELRKAAMKEAAQLEKARLKLAARNSSESKGLGSLFNLPSKEAGVGKQATFSADGKSDKTKNFLSKDVKNGDRGDPSNKGDGKKVPWLKKLWSALFA